MTDLLELSKTKTIKQQRVRRKTISDELITEEILGKLIEKVYSECKEPCAITQLEVVSILLNYKIGNKTIARVVKEILPDSKVTTGSVASLIKYIRQGDDLLNELINSLED